MKKPIPDKSGLALTQLLYGDFDRNADSKVRKPVSKNKRHRTRPRRTRTRYEREKQRLKARNLSPEEYEREIKKLADRLGY